MRGNVSTSTSKYKRRELSIDSQFDRLQTQWKNGQSGAGAWFWQHFKPVLLTVHEGAKELHLQCGHCTKLFSARNPSRTSLEHLKSGACSVFRRTTAYEEVKAVPRALPSAKRGRRALRSTESAPLQSSVSQPPEGTTQTGHQGEAEATEALANFFVESGIPISLMEHPRLLEFCGLAGVAPPDPAYLLSGFLDARFNALCEENETRLRKAGLFQIAVHGRRSEQLIITLNLPEGPPAFFKSVDQRGPGVTDLMQILASTTEELDGIVDKRNCVGWIADVGKEDRTALREAEEKYPWMVHVVCQASALRSLVKDVCKHIEAVSETVDMAQRIVGHFARRPGELETLRQHHPEFSLNDAKSVHAVVAKLIALGSVWNSREALKTAFHEATLDIEEAGDIAAACMDGRFWERVEAAQALLGPVLATLQDFTPQQPHLSQALDMWMRLEAHFAEWCRSYADLAQGVEEVFRKRYGKSYHPAMSAALLLDPGFCAKRDDGRFVPDCVRLSPAQQADAGHILKRMSAPNRGARVASDFGLWRTQGLPPEFGSVVSERTRNGGSCLTKCVPMALRKTIWVSCLKDFEAIGMVAHRLLALKATSAGPIMPKDASDAPLNSSGLLTQSKLQYVRNNARLASGRLVDERLLDMDILSADALRQNVAHQMHAKPDAMVVDTEECGVSEQPSQLYMQQLQLSSLPPAAMRMTPPPLGTMPELPLSQTHDAAPVPSTLHSREDPTFFAAAAHQHGMTESLPSSVEPELGGTSGDGK